MTIFTSQTTVMEEMIRTLIRASFVRGITKVAALLACDVDSSTGARTVSNLDMVFTIAANELLKTKRDMQEMVKAAIQTT